MDVLTPVSEPSAHLDLEAALPVLEESTTSRVLVNNNVMRVVQFTFDAGQLLSEHTSPRAVACILGSGRLTFTVDDVAHSMGPDDVIYLSPGVRHSLVAEERCRLSLVMVDTDAKEADDE